MKQTNLIGVDISDSSIKVLQLDAGNTIVAFGTSDLAQGIVVNGSIVDSKAFCDALNTVLMHTQPKVLRSSKVALRAVLCLPESKLFTHYQFIPDTIKKADVETYVRDEAAKIIPFELKDLYWDYHIAEKGGKRSATFVGVAKKDLDNYVEVFTQAEIKPAFIGGELFSLGHALLHTPFEDDHIILDMGAHSTTVGMFADDAVANTSIVVPMGGATFTDILASKLGVEASEAEKMKREYGLDKAHAATQVPEILEESLAPIVVVINEAKAFFEKKTGDPVKRILIAGGSALLPGLAPYIFEKTGVKAEVADALIKVHDPGVLTQNAPGILFANVIGLALYGAHPRKHTINLLTQYRYDESDALKEKLEIRDIRSKSDLYYVLYSFIQTGKGYASDLSRFARKHLKINLALFFSLAFLAITLAFLGWVIIKFL